MRQKLLYMLKKTVKRYFNNESASKCIVIGAGCSYVYISGLLTYIRVSNGISDNADKFGDPISQLFTTEFASRVSPSLLPLLVKSHYISVINDNLTANSVDIRQRIVSHSALLRITNSKEAIKYLSYNSSKEEELSQKLSPFRNFIKDVLYPKLLPDSAETDTEDSTKRNEPELLFNMKIKSLENLLSNLRPEEREMCYEYMRDLVKLTKLYTSTNAKEKISKILLLLLENRENSVKIVNDEFEQFQSCNLIKRDGESAVNDIILKYLYSSKLPSSYITSIFSDMFPIVSVNSQCVKVVNENIKGLAIKLPEIEVPTLSGVFTKHKKGILTAISALEISYCYAMIRHLLSQRIPGVPKLTEFRMTMREGLKTTRGLLIFQAICAAQNRLIKSEKYFNDENIMFSMSLGICISTWLSLTVISVTQRYFLLPMIIHQFLSQ